MFNEFQAIGYKELYQYFEEVHIVGRSYRANPKKHTALCETSNDIFPKQNENLLVRCNLDKENITMKFY